MAKSTEKVAKKVREKGKVDMAKLNRQEHTKPTKRKARQNLNPPAIAHKPNDLEAKPVMGRPLTYDIEIGRKICDRVAMGETITSICKEPDQPNLQTFYN